MLLFFYLETPLIKSWIEDWVKKFETYGTVQDPHTKSDDVPATLDNHEPIQMKSLVWF